MRVGEGTRDWYQLAHTFADLIADELHAQFDDGQFGPMTADDVVAWLHHLCDDEDAA